MAEIQLGAGTARLRSETFADGEVIVCSPRGLRAPERALLHVLPRGRAGSALVLNSTEAVVGLALRALNPELSVHCHFDDAWDFDVAQATAAKHPELAPEMALAPDPPDGPWDLVLLPLERDGVTELLLERLGSSLGWLKPGGLLFASTNSRRDRLLRDRVLKLFGSATTRPGPSRRGGLVYVARRPREPKLRTRPSERTFTVMEGELPLAFVSRPGVFCHGRLDEGTRLLLASMDIADATRILDLGCGVGVLGLVAALRRPEAQVTLVDSYARAAQCAQQNIETHGLAERCEVLLTANPLASLSPGYDLVLTNPPYYGHYRISEMFLETAARVLVPGGRIVVVTKGVEWHTAAMQQRFGNVQTQEGKGCWVLTSVLRA